MLVHPHQQSWHWSSSSADGGSPHFDFQYVARLLLGMYFLLDEEQLGRYNGKKVQLIEVTKLNLHEDIFSALCYDNQWAKAHLPVHRLVKIQWPGRCSPPYQPSPPLPKVGDGTTLPWGTPGRGRPPGMPATKLTWLSHHAQHPALPNHWEPSSCLQGMGK